MRAIAASLIAMGLAVSFLAACAGHPAVADKSYTCPTCKQSIAWSDNAKGWATVPNLTHTCPDCKKEWAAAPKADTTCATCKEASLKCPICAAAGH